MSTPRAPSRISGLVKLIGNRGVPSAVRNKKSKHLRQEGRHEGGPKTRFPFSTPTAPSQPPQTGQLNTPFPLLTQTPASADQLPSPAAKQRVANWAFSQAGIQGVCVQTAGQGQRAGSLILSKGEAQRPGPKASLGISPRCEMTGTAGSQHCQPA